MAAAPDMLKALEACERRLFGTLSDPFTSELYREVRTTIAKAHGENAA